MAHSQFEFKDSVGAGHFGDFDDLKNSGHIAAGYSVEKIVENYTLTWNVSSTGQHDLGVGLGYAVDSFTIVAFPRDRRPGYLNTFGVTEDQVVRVFNPDNGNKYNDPDDPMVSTWDPIL